MRPEAGPDTIIALSSGQPPAAIAVVRANGPQAPALLTALAGPLPPTRSLSLRAIRDPRSGELLDRALVALFPAETSVTGDTLVELHLHGGRATIEGVIEAALATGLVRAARAGEFTWRAFVNGKTDLIGVESLSDLLRAETAAQRRAALGGEGLTRVVEDVRVRLLQLSALHEAALDQSDEDDVRTDRGEQQRLAEALHGDLQRLLERPGAERLFDGIRVVFAGPPNAGKSTLINALAQREVAIVSPVAGTTRDVIEAPVTLEGLAFVLTDTAGLREEEADPIEREGIMRARSRIAQADIVVWMDDGPVPEAESGKAIAITARADESGRVTDGGRLRVSAVTGEGLAALVGQLIARARALLPSEGDVALTRRQRRHLAEVRDALGRYHGEPDDLIGAEHLRQARAEIDSLTGRAGTENMLDALFGTFCIGK